MNNNNKNLFNQINQQIATNVFNAPTDVNPSFKKTSVNQTTSINNIPVTNTSSSFQWLIRKSVNEFTSAPSILDNTSFMFYGTKIDSYITDSADGNLSLANLVPNRIYAFSANIERSVTSASVTMNINFPGTTKIFLNGVLIHSSGNNINNSLSIPLTKGWNVLEVFIWSGPNNSVFSTGGQLGKFADRWTVPAYTASNTPVGLTVRRDPNEISANTYINIVKWDLNSDGQTNGYKAYRRGPYTSFLGSPSGVLLKPVPSGDMSPNTSYFYSISAYNSTGESLPYKFTSNVTTTPIDPYISFSCIGSDATGTLISTGYYYYGIDYFGAENKKTGLLSTISGFFNPYSSALLQWQHNIDILTGVYEFTPSGVNIYRSQTLPFGVNSLLTIITGLEILSYIDTSGVLSAGQPRSDSQIISGIGIRLDWNPPEIGTPATYYIYRSPSAEFLQETFLASTTETTFFDSGYIATTGVPTDYKNLADLLHPTNRYDDVGVKRAQTYDYAISSYNNLLIESDKTSPITITVGDSVAPSTPTGIYVTVSDAYANLTWQNGIEDDLVGTKIYYSTIENGTFNLIADVQDTTAYSKYVGYSATGYFKLANYDWSENLSSQSSGVSGVTISAPITTIPPNYSWSFTYLKNPITTGNQIITIVAPTIVDGTPEIKLKQYGQSDYSFVTPIQGTTPIFSGYYTVVNSFDGPAEVIASGNATDGSVIFSSSMFSVDTVAPVDCFINFGF